MEKLKLLKGNNQINVLEIDNLRGKEQVIVGNYDRDLILRTKGSVIVQVQNKFYDLLSSEGESVITGGFKPIFVLNINERPSYPDGSLIVELSTGQMYSYYDNNLINLTEGDSSITTGYLSYSELQNLTAAQQTRANVNLGIYWNGLDQRVFYEDQILFNTLSGQHELFKNGVLNPLYIKSTGGTVNGDIIFTGKSNFISWNNGTIVKPNDDFKGFIISDTTNERFSLLTNNQVNILESFSGKDFVFRMNEFQDRFYNDVMTLSEKGVLVGNGYHESTFDLTVNGKVYSEFISIKDIVQSHDYNDSDDIGFSLEGYMDDDFSKRWSLIIDELTVRYPNSTYEVRPNTFIEYLSKSYSVEDIQISEEAGEDSYIDFHSNEGLSQGDILVGITYNWNNEVSSYTFVELLSRELDDDNLPTETWIVNIDSVDGGSFDKLVKIGSTVNPSSNIILDSTKDNIKIVTQVNNIDVLFPNGKPDLEDELRLNEIPQYPSSNITSVLGNLSEVIDSDFNLNKPNQFGFYSNNVYIKGKADLNYLKLGTSLLYNGSVLTIADLEIIKSRSITGTDGLNGGGNLFTSDIVIKHNTGSWTNKTALTGASVISNLTVDTYGHITNWTTRTLTKTDIGLGNVDNTSDINKPISAAVQTALDNKADKVTTILGTGSLIGGGNLTANRTLDLSSVTKADIAKGVLAESWGDFRDFGLGISGGGLLLSGLLKDISDSSFKAFSSGGAPLDAPWTGASGSSKRAGAVLIMGSENANYRVQLFLDRNTGEIMSRGGVNLSDSGDDWKMYWHDGNLRSNTQNDARYVLKSGDTMTGPLDVRGAVIASSVNYNDHFKIIRGSNEGNITLGADGNFYFDKRVSAPELRATQSLSLPGTTSQYVRGDGSLATYNATPSDSKLKDNTTSITNAVDKLSLLDGKSWIWKEDSPLNGQDYGFLAEDIELVFPEMVSYNEDSFTQSKKYNIEGEEVIINCEYDDNYKSENSYKQIKNGYQIQALLVNAIKELNERILILESRLLDNN